MSRVEMATLAQIVARTLYISVLVNCADVKVPEKKANGIGETVERA